MGGGGDGHGHAHSEPPPKHWPKIVYGHDVDMKSFQQHPISGSVHTPGASSGESLALRDRFPARMTEAVQRFRALEHLARGYRGYNALAKVPMDLWNKRAWDRPYAARFRAMDRRMLGVFLPVLGVFVFAPVVGTNMFTWNGPGML